MCCATLFHSGCVQINATHFEASVLSKPSFFTWCLVLLIIGPEWMTLVCHVHNVAARLLRAKDAVSHAVRCCATRRFCCYWIKSSLSGH